MTNEELDPLDEMSELGRRNHEVGLRELEWAHHLRMLNEQKARDGYRQWASQRSKR